MKAASLRYKILIGLALISFCAMTTLVLILRSYLATTLEAQLIKRGDFAARTLADQCVTPILSRQQLVLDLKLHEITSADKEFAYIFIIDSSRKPISHTFKDGFPVGLKELNNFSDQRSLTTRLRLGEQDIVDISVPVLDGRLGRLHVGMSPYVVQKEISAILFYVSGVICLLFLGAAVVLWLYLERIILHPIRELDSQVKLLGQGHFEAHLQVHSRDELGTLGTAFNDMGRHLSTLYEEISDRNHDLSKLNEKLEQLAVTDGLTGLYNHRHFYERLHDEVSRARRYNHQLALIMADIDHFKRYNDALGHVAGDRVLKIIAELIAENARENDLVARYGGEEFAIILPETMLETAVGVAERIRTIIESSPELAALAVTPGEAITMSFGVACLDEATENTKLFVHLADSMLYKAKQNGRNRVES